MDSELDAFVAKSDDPIETFSSSLPNTQNWGLPAKKAGRLKPRAKQAPIQMESDDIIEDAFSGEEDDGATSRGGQTVVDLDEEVSEEDVQLFEVEDTGAAAGRGKKRRVVQDSDSDE